MKINYTGADGKILELEVTDEVGTFYLESVEAEKRSDRRESRRHTSLETFSYEDARYFSDKSDMVSDFIESETIRHALSQLTERQEYLIRKCCLEGWSYSDLARQEGKDESAIRHAVNRAKSQLKKHLS